MKTIFTTIISQVRELSKQETSSLGKQWSSTSTETEGFADTPATKSAPPIMGEKSIWEPISKDYHTKPPLQRAEAVNWGATSARRDLRYSGDTSKSLRSYHPVRRPLREKPPPEDRPDVYPYDQTPNKLEQILGRPEAPVRSTRKQKRGHVKSLGEEVTDSSSLDKSILLGTIDESKAHLDVGKREEAGKQILTPKRQRQNLPQLDLRRRNSDPATKATISDHPAGLGKDCH